MKKTLLAIAAATASAAVFAQAAEAPAAPEPDYTFSFNVGAVTDYRYRGVSQSRKNPALQGGIDFAHKSGFYLGTWASTIKWIKDAGGKSDAEVDFYGGFKNTIGDSGVGFDVGVLRYQYFNNKLTVSPNTTEIYGALSYSVVTAKYSRSTGNLFGFSNSSGSGYLDVSATFDLGNGFSLVPHVGHQSVSNNGFFSYTDYSLTLGKDFGNGLSASLAVLDTNAHRTAYVTPSGKNTAGSTLVAGIKYAF
ncbi:MAG: TorF family putative porin [Pseudomonadota bacterium]